MKVTTERYLTGGVHGIDVRHAQDRLRDAVEALRGEYAEHLDAALSATLRYGGHERKWLRLRVDSSFSYVRVDKRETATCQLIVQNTWLLDDLAALASVRVADPESSGVRTVKAVVSHDSSYHVRRLGRRFADVNEYPAAAVDGYYQVVGLGFDDDDAEVRAAVRALVDQ